MSTHEFDRVAARFDQAHALPADVGDQLRDLVLTRLGATPVPRLLELGSGTGRIAAPFVATGCPYVGLDNSAAMLARCREKLGSEGRLGLVLGDMRRLPFPDGAFGAIIAASVFRAARPWQVAAREAARVLARPGIVVLVHHETVPGSVEAEVAEWKREFLGRLGVGAYPVGGADDAVVAEYYVNEGATLETLQTASWMTRQSPQQTIERQLRGNRIEGQSFAAALRQELEMRARQDYGALDTLVPVERHLVLRILHFPAP